MIKAGIIGGIGPEASIVYYRSIISSYREHTGGGSYPADSSWPQSWSTIPIS